MCALGELTSVGTVPWIDRDEAPALCDQDAPDARLRRHRSDWLGEREDRPRPSIVHSVGLNRGAARQKEALTTRRHGKTARRSSQRNGLNLRPRLSVHHDEGRAALALDHRGNAVPKDEHLDDRARHLDAALVMPPGARPRQNHDRRPVVAAARSSADAGIGRSVTARERGDGGIGRSGGGGRYGNDLSRRPFPKLASEQSQGCVPDTADRRGGPARSHRACGGRGGIGARRRREQ